MRRASAESCAYALFGFYAVHAWQLHCRFGLRLKNIALTATGAVLSRVCGTPFRRDTLRMCVTDRHMRQQA